MTKKFDKNTQLYGAYFQLDGVSTWRFSVSIDVPDIGDICVISSTNDISQLTNEDLNCKFYVDYCNLFEDLKMLHFHLKPKEDK